MADLIKLAALWKRTDKNGKTFYSGKINDTADILLFQNTKTKETQPDLMLYVCMPKPKPPEPAQATTTAEEPF